MTTIDLSAGLVPSKNTAKPATPAQPATAAQPAAPSTPAQPAQPIDLSAGVVQKPAGYKPVEPINKADDSGAMMGASRVAANILKLPGNLWDALTTPAKDVNEEMSADVISRQHSLPKPIALALHRLIVAPMVHEHEVADEYERRHKLLSPEDQEKEKEFTNTQSNYHAANMHRIGSYVPILGPMAADMAERYLQGDHSGAITELGSNVLAGEMIKKLGGHTMKALGPETRVLAGEEVPVLKSQTGGVPAKVASATETVAKASGKTGEVQLGKFADRQQAAGQRAIAGVAQENSTAAAKPIVENVNPLTMTADDFSKMNEATKALPKAQTFTEAAENLKKVASEHFNLIDHATDGEFNTLRGERGEIYRKMRQPGADTGALRDDLNDLTKRENAMFDKAGLAENDKTALSATRQAWRRACAMEELGSRIEGATKTMLGEGGVDAPLSKKLQGKALLNAIDGMDQKTMSDAVADPKHVADLRKLGALLENTQNLSRASTALKLLRASRAFGLLAHPVAIGSTEGLSYMLGKILTNPGASRALTNGLKIGASTPVIANMIGKNLEAGQKPAPEQDTESDEQ